MSDTLTAPAPATGRVNQVPITDDVLNVADFNDRIVGAYNDALERSLGVPDGSLPLMDADPNILSEWMASSWGGSSIAKFDLEVEPLSQQKTEKGGNSSISTGGMQSGPSRTAKL